MAAHKISFCIKDKSDDFDAIKRQRLDSLVELTNSGSKRLRTKSEAVQDISSSSINEFVQQILDKEFKVFEEIKGESSEKKKGEKRMLEQALKLMKVLNFLFSNQEIISQQGISFIMKTTTESKKDGE